MISLLVAIGVVSGAYAVGWCADWVVRRFSP